MRKLATAAAVSLALASGGAFGLGLGEIEMRSALNQPMNAEIRLTSVQTGELDGMIVQLASPQAFARAGIERSPALTDLRFSVDQSSGTPVIRISSQRPVVEPFLNFLLEVDWPQGRMVREYTVLLDPPVFMTPTATERNTSSDQPTVVQQGNDSLIVPTPIERQTADSGEAVNLELLEAGESAANGEAVELSAEEGEVVSLDVVSDDALLGTAPSAAASDGDVISLTDLSAPNSAALEEREAFLAEQQARLDAITVELADSVEEVADTVVVAGENVAAEDGSTIVSLDSAIDEADSTIVSLDDLQPADEQSESTQTAAVPAEREVQVGQGDTLYEIARDAAGDSVSVQQMMMALLTANESAFINRNINLVRAGSILRIPDTDTARELTQTQALAAISQQNQLWQEYRNSLGSGGTRIATGTGSDAGSSADSTAETAAIETAALDPELGSEDAADGLSPEARAILENARNEILDRDELRIVADSSPTSTTASATADETADSDAARLGEVNLKLQLAREELSATRLTAEELADQVSELDGTTENLDSLVSLRQNEIAQLESQLAEARQAQEAANAEAELADAGQSESSDGQLAAVGEVAEEAAGELSETASDVAGAAGTAVQDAVQDTVQDSADGVSDLAAEGSQALSEGADAVAQAGETAVDAAGGVVSEASDAAADATDSGVNALTAAGQELAQVELVDESAESAAESAAGDGDAQADASASTSADESATPTAQLQSSWYEDFINDPKRMAIAGVGAVGLLGVLGTLLFRRKRRDDELLDVDEAEFNEEELAAMQANATERAADNGAGLATGVAAAGAAVTGTAAGLAGKADDVIAMPADMSNDAAAAGAALDQDDTISEVDVYLAYGLHGQAEELLAKATERDPNNQEYVHKLLQTYHAQGNAEGFHSAAENFHARFGGEANPEWASIAAMGTELRPGDDLYSAAKGTVDRIGSGHSDGEALSEDDFLSGSDTDAGSISREFGTQPGAEEPSAADETELLDQSLDPAFAFDESDLEATGDFSEIANAVAAENAEAEADDGSIDFPGLDADASAAELADTVSDKAADMASDGAEQLSKAAGDLGNGMAERIGEASDDLTSELSADLTGDGDLSADALTLDELDRVASVDDLTLDLDQLSGDLELDGAELMNSDLSELELPDLTADNDLLLDGDADNSDEMETMLDLAKAYIDMGDKDSASTALDEIVKSGNPDQVTEAETLLRKIS